MPTPAIKVENLSKRYHIGAEQQHDSLRDAIAHWAKHPIRRLKSFGRSSHREEDTIWALKDVSFEVQPGEVLGVIGPNGAGKSTLLKILSRITEPTLGRAEINGRVSSLLEVGTGFHHELTGRENIYLSGSVLGLRKAEIDEKFDEIVEFSGVEKFIDTPVKRYSSGMKVRLGFAVAAHLNPEVLLIDEVLAVGDAEFQSKCLGKMDDVTAKGRTIIFVSHNMSSIKNLCERTLLLEGGSVAADDSSIEVIDKYLGRSTEKEGFDDTRRQASADRVKITDAWIEKNGEQQEKIMFGDQVSIMLNIEVLRKTCFSVEVMVRDRNGMPIVFAPSGLVHGWELEEDSGSILVEIRTPPLRWAQGRYKLDLMLADTGVSFFDYVKSCLSMHIENTSLGSSNWSFSQENGQGFLLWDCEFHRRR